MEAITSPTSVMTDFSGNSAAVEVKTSLSGALLFGNYFQNRGQHLEKHTRAEF